MPALPLDTLTRLRAVSTATLTTQLFKRGLRNCFMRGVQVLGKLEHNLVGPAFTLRNIPAREDIDHVGVFTDPEHPQRKSPSGKFFNDYISFASLNGWMQVSGNSERLGFDFRNPSPGDDSD